MTKLISAPDPALAAMLGVSVTYRPHMAHLIGKAASSLVTFHLSRRGFNCVATTDSCGSGDLWAEIDGAIRGIEVKGSTQSSWHLRRAQLEAVALFAFVNVTNGTCWIVSAVKVTEFFNINGLNERDGHNA